MRYRLVAVDLDDTLLTDDLTVSEATREAMKQAMARGVQLTFATGRSFISALQFARQIGLDVPIITYQGSLIRHARDGQTLYERYVPAAVAEQVEAYCRKHRLHLQTYIDDRLYALEDNDKLRKYAALSGIPYTVVNSFQDLGDASARQIKMIMIDESARLDAIKPELEQMLGPDVHLTKSKSIFLEVLHREGTKGHALQYLAAHYNIPMEQTIAIGDAWNDKEMIEAAGLGVAMANAIPEIRELADYVTLSNNEDGVRHVIEKFVLQPQ